jgi:hypothetical protein
MKSFSLGNVVATPGVLDAVGMLGVNRVIERHSKCDWGEASEDSIQMNNEAVESGDGDILSVYDINGTKVWVQTYIGKVTTVLLPSEY